MFNAIQRHLPLQETSFVVAKACTMRNAHLLKGGKSFLLSSFPEVPRHWESQHIIKNCYTLWGEGGWKQIHDRAGKIENYDPWPGFLQAIPAEKPQISHPTHCKTAILISWSCSTFSSYKGQSEKNGKSSGTVPTDTEHACLHRGSHSAPPSCDRPASQGVREGYRRESTSVQVTILSFYCRKYSTKTTFTPEITLPFLMSNVMKLWHHS